MYSKVGLWTDNSNSAGSGYHSCACLTIYPSGWKSRLRLTIAKASAGDTNRNQACDKLFKMYGGTTGDKIDIDYDVEGKNMVF